MRSLVGRVLAPGLGHAGVCGLLLAFLVVPPFALIQRIEASKPVRPHLEQAWETLSDGMAVSTALERMGPADSVRDVHELIPSCPSPCAVGAVESPACTTFRTCLKQYEWQVDPEAPSTVVFNVCADEKGTILRVSSGMAFELLSF